MTSNDEFPLIPRVRREPIALLVSLFLLAGCAADIDIRWKRPTPDQPPAPEGEVLPVPASIEARGVPPIPRQLTDRLSQYQNTRSASLSGWYAPGQEGAILISTRFGQTNQLHKVLVPGGARTQLTFFPEPVRSAALSPNPNVKGFVYPRDVGGSEYFQLFWYDSLSGASTLLTDGHSRYSSVLFSNAGDRFAYTTTERDGEHWDIHLQDLAGYKRVALETERYAWSAADWSNDDQRLLLEAYVSAAESHIYELNLVTGEKRQLLDPDLKTSVGYLAYDGNSEGVFFTSDLGAEFKRLHYLDLASGNIEVVTGDLPWDVEAMAVSDDGRWLAYSINEDGISRLQLLSLPERSFVALPELPQGLIGALTFDATGKRLGFTLNTAVSPTDVYSLDLANRDLTRWTYSEVGGLNPDRFVTPLLIHYPSFDTANGAPITRAEDQAREIPAFLYQPPGSGPFPVVIRIHGGPESQSRPYFSYINQFLVNELGVAVLVPNVRGSRGYGKTYLGLDNGFLREDSVKDIGALLDWVASQPNFDADRVAVMGGSYGGYMVLAAMVHYSDRLRAGLDSVGISNFVSFLENTKAYRRDLRRVEYGDERDPEMRAFLERISPLHQVDRITRPMFISQGQNDPRVPVGESEQIVKALEAEGLPVWYVLARDEGHGFRKKANRDYNVAAEMLFLRRYLLDGLPSGEALSETRSGSGEPERNPPPASTRISGKTE